MGGRAIETKTERKVGELDSHKMLIKITERR
nr:MAG TPA: hypothetical protein [Caudoviricetes sp.]